MATSKQARRIRVVDGRFQYRTIAISLATILGGLILFAAAAALWYLLSRASGGVVRPELLLEVLPLLLVNDLAIMLLVIVVGIFTTHRIAGPIYRIESDVGRVLSGERGVRIRLRRRDAFPELAERVNQLIERFDDSRKG